MNIHQLNTNHMTKYLIKLTILISLLAAVSCTKLTEKDAIATYSSGSVTQKDLLNQLNILKSQNNKLKDISVKSLSDKQKKFLVNEIILRKISSGRSKNFNLHKTDDYKSAMTNFSDNLLQKKLYIKLAQEATNEEFIKENYQKLKSKLSDKKDYKIAVIIVNTEKEAKGLRYRLKKNKKLFNYFASKKSIDKALAKNKGVVDYSNETTISPTIISNIKNFKTGQISKPINLGKKWALIKFIDKRDAAIKSFKESKSQLSQSMATQAIKTFTDNALKEAKITMINN